MTLEPKAAKLWTPTEKWVLVVLVAGLVSSLFVLVHPWYDRTPDSSVYVILARSLAAGEGYVYLGMPFRLRPPGFPALVALVVRTCDTNFLALNALVSVLGAAAVVLLFLHQRDRVGWVLALLTAVAVWLNPGYQRLCNQVMSDVPGLALLLLCLLVERRASRAPSLRHEALLGLAIGLAAYVRSASILLLPAIALARILARSRQEGARGSWRSFATLRLAPFALVTGIVVLPWNVSQRLVVPPQPADQTLNYSLSTAMWHTDPGDPASPRIGVGELVARVPPHLREMAGVLGSRMQLRIPGSPPPSPRASAVHAAVAALLVVSLFLVLHRRRGPAELFASLTLLVVAVYFVFTDRLLLPAYVFGFAAAIEVLRDVLRRLLGARPATLVTSVAILSLVALDFKPRHDWPTIEQQHRSFVELAAAVNQHLAPDARLAAGQGFHYGVYLDRPVYNLMHGVRRAGRPDGAEEIIDKYRINTVVLSALVPPDQMLVPYFEERYGPGERAGSARVWRVRPAETPRPHIILVTSDTLRADHLSVNGYPRATSPALDAFSRVAWHFTDAVTVIPKTAPSFATMFTGRHPEEHRVRSNFDSIPESLTVLAERLKSVGYRTAAFVGNPVLRTPLGFARGFDRYENYDAATGDAVRAVNEAFLRWAEQPWDRPTFVWVHYMDPHGPYTPPPELERPFLDDEWARSDARVRLEPELLPGGNPNKVLGAIPAYQRRDGEDRVAVYVARYDAEIRYMDAAFAELLRSFERRGGVGPSVVIFTSDHGESLGERDFYFEHGWFANEPALHIPLIIKLPGQVHGRVVSEQVSLLDFLPTVLALAGAPADAGALGTDLFAASAKERPPVVIQNSDQYPEKYYGVRTSRWKYLIRSRDGVEELYDLQADRAEAHNLTEREPATLGELRRACAEALERLRESATSGSGATAPDDPAVLERLKALGYLE